MKHIMGPNSRSSLTNVKEGDVQPNAVDLRLGKVFKMSQSTFKIDEKENSYGTIGPSLHNFGKIRGVTDPNSAAAKPIVEYTWGKIWNAKAYNACSNMPRVGHSGILTEAQVRHVVGLLLDPQSPVNK
jgi:sulfur oxidation c-type cytochrome SoxX